MDDNSWAELARLAREAKAELETEHPTAVLDISACENVVALAAGAALKDEWSIDPEILAEWGLSAPVDRLRVDEMWTGDPAVLADRFEGATVVAVAVQNARNPNEPTNLLLGGVEYVAGTFMTWFAGAAKGVRREGLVMPRASGVYPDIAYVLLREYPVTDTAATGARASAEPDADID